MVYFLFLAGLLASLSNGMPSNECCMTKEVGDLSYTLVGRMDTKMFNCKDNCVYQRTEEPDTKFCFKTGELVAECTEEGSYSSNHTDIWIATGEVPDKLAQAPPEPLYLTYNKKKVMPNDTIPTEDMLETPSMKWKAEEGALYTIIMIDFGITRLGGLQYYHWMVSNVASGDSIDSGDEVYDYIAPFTFTLTNNNTEIDQTMGEPNHDILTLVYKQTNGRVNMTDIGQSGCNPSIVERRIGDHAAVAEKYALELVAGNFFFTTYTDASNNLLCYMTKCTGNPFPIPAPGINDGPECQQ